MQFLPYLAAGLFFSLFPGGKPEIKAIERLPFYMPGNRPGEFIYCGRKEKTRVYLLQASAYGPVLKRTLESFSRLYGIDEGLYIYDTDNLDNIWFQLASQASRMGLPPGLIELLYQRGLAGILTRLKQTITSLEKEVVAD